LAGRDLAQGVDTAGAMRCASLAYLTLALPVIVAGAAPRAHAQRKVHVLGPETMQTHQGTHESVVNAVRADMRLDVVGRPSARGLEFEAAYQKLVLKTETAHAQTIRAGSYTPVDQPHQVKISGVPGGLLRATHLGTTSSHDLGGNQARIDARALSDRVRIAIDHGEGTPQRILVDRGLSGHVSLHDIEIPLKLGTPTRLLYERLDQAGNILGGRLGYQSGRILELHWDGQ